MTDFSKIENQLCFTLYETSNEFTKLYTKVLQPFGLTYPQYLVLLALWEKNELTLKELGEKLSLGTGTLTPMIKRMEANEWVKKERSITDERNIRILLKPKAIKEKDFISKEVSKLIISCNFELEEYNILMTQLQQVKSKLKARNKNLHLTNG